MLQVSKQYLHYPRYNVDQVHFKGGKYFYALQVTLGPVVLFKCGPIREHLRPGIKLQSNRTNKYPTSVTYNLVYMDVLQH